MGQGRKPGLDLIEVLEDPMDRRGKIAFLTPKGRTLACVLLRILDPESQVDPSAFMSVKEYLSTGAR